MSLETELDAMADHLDLLDAREQIEGMEEVSSLLRRAASAINATTELCRCGGLTKEIEQWLSAS